MGAINIANKKHITVYKLRLYITAVLFTLCSLLSSLAVFESASAATKATQVSTGNDTACAVVNGKAKCWGKGGSGQLGNNSYSSSSTPVDVYAQDAYTETIPAHQECSFIVNCKNVPEQKIKHTASAMGGKTVTKVSVGTSHACAVADAAVYCWGSNSDGQLGTRSNSGSNEPVTVDTAAAVARTCTKFSNNGKNCVQYNVPAAKPASALRNKEIVDVSVGNNFSCALATDGAIACWGNNDHGQLGNNSKSSSNYPVAVATNAKFKKLGLVKGDAETMCAITTNSRGMCWGQNYAGQVGDGSPLQNGTGEASGSIQTSNDTDCRKDSQTLLNRTNIIDIPDLPGDVLTPSNVAGGLLFSSITVWGVVGEGDSTVPDDISLPAQGKTSGTLTSTAFSGYSYVTGLTTETSPSPNRAYYWGGTVEFVFRFTCTHNGSGGNANSTNGDRTNASLNKSYTFLGVSNPTGPLYNSDLARQIKSTPLALSSGNAYNGSNWSENKLCASKSVKGNFGQMNTVTTCNESPDNVSCAVPKANRDKIYCDDASQTCNTTGSAVGDAVLKANGQWRCDPNGPQAVASGSGSWLQPGMTNAAIDTGFSNYTCSVANGSIGCWGKNGSGQLGVGDSKARSIPTAVKL